MSYLAQVEVYDLPMELLDYIPEEWDDYVIECNLEMGYFIYDKLTFIHRFELPHALNHLGIYGVCENVRGSENNYLLKAKAELDEKTYNDMMLELTKVVLNVIKEEFDFNYTVL